MLNPMAQNSQLNPMVHNAQQHLRHVQNLVASMAQLQANNGKPLTNEQQELMRTHLLLLHSGTQQPSSQQVTDHAAAMLRAFASGTRPPDPPRPLMGPNPGPGPAPAPTPAPMAPAPSLAPPPAALPPPALPAARPPAPAALPAALPGVRPPGQPAGLASMPTQQQLLALQAALPLLLQRQAAAGGGAPNLANLASLMNLIRPGMVGGAAGAAAGRGTTPRPVLPRMGFTKEQLEVLRAQIIVFRKLKRGETITPADVAPQAIKPQPLLPVLPLQPSGASAQQGGFNRPAGGRGSGRGAGRGSTRATPPPAAALPVPKVTQMAAPVVPGPLGKPLHRGPREDVPPWRGPPPEEYRGSQQVARFAGPLMSLGEPQLEPPTSMPPAQAHLVPQVKAANLPGHMGPQFDVPGLIAKELNQLLLRKRKRRMDDILALLAADEADRKRAAAAPGPSMASAPARPAQAALPAPAAGQAAVPVVQQPTQATQQPPPQEEVKAELEAMAVDEAPGPVQTAAAAADPGPAEAGAAAVKAEPAADAAALVVSPMANGIAAPTTRGPGGTAGRGGESGQGAAGGQGRPRGQGRLVQGFVVGPDGQPARGALLMELRKLRLMELQTQLRKEVEDRHMVLAYQPDKDYKLTMKQFWLHRKNELRARDTKRITEASNLFQRWCDFRQAQLNQVQLVTDLRKARNKAVLRLHDRLARELSKRDDTQRRMEALRANDLEAYKEMIKQDQGVSAKDDHFNAITKFLNDTEEYLNKLAARLARFKLAHESQEYVQAAMDEARAAGMSQEEIYAAGMRAAEAIKKHSEITRKAESKAGDAQSRFYELAHSKQEDITHQPSLLKPPNGAKLREYQMVGLRWMVSLYNNNLNGILADEMGLGKTVQVMALIAYLIEHKYVYGPHLIIVPNAVIVNWKSELQTWLPGVKCVYYVGNKDERTRKYQQEVMTMNFNVLVTTYEFIMRDRAKLARVEWKYIIIDEAQRLKERQSKLSRDLDKFTTGRRLLLTGTPLQNELRELWNLLNLLLPEMFDDKQQFGEWFDTMLEGEDDEDDDGMTEKDEKAALASEKKLVVVHRLHQILMPFMLRRQVQDVEGKLPPKVPVIIKVPMTPYQSAIYNWVRLTGTLKLAPGDPVRDKLHRDFAGLNNKVMELRKICNHPLLSYAQDTFSGPDMLAQCGKLVVLDRLLVKLTQTGHRVLLFCTMTKLLDLLEHYLRWRTLPDGKSMQYRRIDGSTPLEARETAIQDFNRPDSDVFIFLLSIRAAGRGLNLQTSDTVVIYDPDPNPKNEEQAIARSHRIGQKKEVRVIHLETVTDPVDYSLGTAECAEQLRHVLEEAQQQGRRPRYTDSVESLVRNIIQKQKIDMANEVIDAGRFDMKATNEERKATLEAMLHDEDRQRVPQNEILDWHQLNKQVARGDTELEVFDALDEEFDWPGGDIGVVPQPGAVPEWLAYSRQEAIDAQRIAQKKASVTGVLAIQDGTLRAGKGRGRGGYSLGGALRGRGRGRGRGARGRGRGRGRAPGFGRASTASMQAMGSLAAPEASQLTTSQLQGGLPYIEEEEAEGPSSSAMYSGGAPTRTVAESEGGDDEEEVQLVEQEEEAEEEEEHLENNLLTDEDTAMDVDGAGPSGVAGGPNGA